MAILKGGLNFISSVASGGVAHILTTDTNYTSGKMLSVRNNGVEKAYIDYAGNYSGTWAGTTIDETVGGTGQTTYASGDILYASAANTISKLAKGTDDQVLTLVSGLPSWETSGAGVSTLDALTDTTITTVGSNEVLMYSGGAWINRTLAEAGIAAASHTHTTSQITNLSSWAGSVNITSVGTLGAGTWQGTAIGEIYGGTGAATYAAGDILYSSSTNNLSKLTIGTNGEVLKVNGGLPSWETEGGGSAHVLGSATHTDVVITAVADNEVLAYDDGSGYWINQTAAEAGLSTTSHGHTFASLSGKPTTISGYGITDAVSDSELASWTGTSSVVTVGTVGTGTWQGDVVDEDYGGTGLNSYAAGDILYASANNTLGKLGIGSNGQVMKINAGIPSWQTEGGGTSHTLGSATHTDVVITSVVNNDILGYDSGGNWINQTAAELGLSTTGHTHAFADLTSKPTTLSGYGITDAVGEARTLTINGTSDRITLTGGTQSLAANRTWTVDVSSNYAGQSTITTVGTISAGTWQGTPIGSSYLSSHVHSAADISTGTLAVARGGTNVSSYVAGDLLYATGTTTLAKLGIGTEDQVLAVSAGLLPEWVTGGGGGAVVLPDLTDVTITSLADLELLQYDDGSGDWINQTIAEIGLVETSRTVEILGTTNEVEVTGASQDLSTNRTWTIGLPSSVTVTTVNATTGNIDTLNSDVGHFTTATGTANAIDARITGDSGPRLKVQGDGVIAWGAGDTTFDLNLYRAASGTLKTDYSLNVVQDLDVGGNLDVTGNITSATWQGDAVGPTYGGTGQSTYTAGDILYASATNTLSKLGISTDGYVLTLASGAPVWAAQAAGDVPSSRTLTINGTTNEITVTGGTQSLAANRTWTVALPAGTLYPNSHINLPDTTNIYFGTGNDTYIGEESANQLTIVAGTQEVFQASATSTYIRAGSTIYLDDSTEVSGSLTSSGDIQANSGILRLLETTTPTPDTNYGKIYTKSTNALFFQDGAGTEHTIDLDGSGGSATLGELTDVTLATTPADNEVLAYDSGGDWINQTAAEAGLAPAVGVNTIVTVGTITTGGWTGTAVAEGYGGTGQTTYASGDILYASAANTLSKLSKGSDGDVLKLASGVPSWAAEGGGDPHTLGSATHTDVVIDATPVNNDVLAYDSGGNWINQTAAEAGLAASGHTHTFASLTSKPTTLSGYGITDAVSDTELAAWPGSANITTLGTIATGTWSGTTIAETKGGTGMSSFTVGDMIVSDGVNQLAQLPVGSNGDFLKVVAGAPTWSAAGVGTVTNVTVGTGLDVANGTTTPNITLDLSELNTHTAAAATDFLIIDEAGVGDRRITFEQVNLSWFNDDIGTGSHNLAFHNDVVITTPANNEVLAYDSGGNWINQTAAEAGLATATHTQAVDKGGTGLTSIAVGDMLVGDGVNSFRTMAKGNDGEFLKVTSGTIGWSSAGTGTVTEVTVNAGLDVTNGTTTPDLTLDLSEVPLDTGLVLTEFLIGTDGTAGNQGRFLVDDIDLGQFNNDQGWTSSSGTVTSVSGASGLTGTVTTTGNITPNFSGLTATSTLISTDDLVVVDGSASRKIQCSSVNLSIFNNNSGWTSNAGTVTSVSGGTGIDSSGGSTPSITLDVYELSVGGTLSGADWLIASNGTASNRQLISNIPLSIFNDDLGGGSGTVTSVSAGNGMSFTTITATGSVTMGSPSTLSASTSNGLTSTSHTHAITATDAGTSSTIVKTTSAGDIRASEDVIAYYSSDRRLKEDIREISNALEKVNALRGVTFAWSEAAGEGKQDARFHNEREAGVIAQEVLEVLPEAVKKRASGYYGVKYEQIIPLLIGAVKELSDKVRILEG